MINEMIITKVFFASNKPRIVNMTKIQIINSTRLIIPLSGNKHVLIGDGHNIVDLNLKKGQALCIPPLCGDRPLWKSSHEMISIVFHSHCLRLLYINYDAGTGSEYPEPDFVYHLGPGPSTATFHAMQALINANRSSRSEDLLPMLTMSLLRLIANDLQKMEDAGVGKALGKYLDIAEYVQGNLQSQVTRQDIADIFKITPQHVSYLFKSFYGRSFSEFLTGCRIDRATALLLQSDMTMDEIAEECNYGYTSHFIKMFKRQHGTSPAKFRLANKK